MASDPKAVKERARQLLQRHQDLHRNQTLERKEAKEGDAHRGNIQFVGGLQALPNTAGARDLAAVAALSIPAAAAAAAAPVSAAALVSAMSPAVGTPAPGPLPQPRPMDSKELVAPPPVLKLPAQILELLKQKQPCAASKVAAAAANTSTATAPEMPSDIPKIALGLIPPQIGKLNVQKAVFMDLNNRVERCRKFLADIEAVYRSHTPERLSNLDDKFAILKDLSEIITLEVNYVIWVDKQYETLPRGIQKAVLEKVRNAVQIINQRLEPLNKFIWEQQEFTRAQLAFLSQDKKNGGNGLDARG